ncbi:hypothetical protein BD289DRAFT_454868 [Coniella lustricola]|uniref:Uncharacterized protein n=1 Tax=Coniella lustricola TaxID=2025994 RepID=A0A2T3A1Y2_9PEZI|nr:hypothetical protein BD289DRAFT_454868 [Coniella lustricola]
MSSTTRLRSRSSVDHIFELVGNIEEDQLRDLLQEINSSGDNIEVSKGVEYFEEQRRKLAPHSLRPTPSFLNQPHEPVDWPRQKPRPVSGSQWRQSMRIVSTPYATMKRNQTEPISPPLTASPPHSPPLSPPQSTLDHYTPRRSVTAPILKTAIPAIEARADLLESPISPPRSSEADDDDVDGQSHRPALSDFNSFNFGLDGPAEPTPEEIPCKTLELEEQGQSPRQPDVMPRASQHDFSRMNTMPLEALHHESLGSFHDLPRPNTSTGGPETSAFKPRAFRRISRPTFLSPLNVPEPDDLAMKLSAYLTGELATPPPSQLSKPKPANKVPSSLEEMLREPLTPRSRFVFGHVERETPSVNGIFEVLKQG